MAAASTDEIYERYLQKAISEINELGHEIGRAGDETRPVLGSGHPLADVFLLKHAPKPSEIQEGVAFFGRAGEALKSLQRLHVDPMAVYGTNCLKFGGESFEEASPWLTRELHIVQPKLLVLMGEQTVEFVNALGFPLSDEIDPAARGCSASRPRSRRSSSPTSTPRSTRRRPRRPSGTHSRPSAAGTPSCRRIGRGAGRIRGADGRARALHGRRRPALEAGLWPDLIFLTLVLFPAFALVWLLLPLREHRAMLPAGLALGALAVLLHLAELDVLNNLAKLFALVCVGFWFLSWFENVMWAALIAVLIPWVDAISVWRGPTEYVVEQQPQIFDTVSIAFRVPGEDGTANLGPPDILFFSLFLAAADRFALASRGRGWR